MTSAEAIEYIALLYGRASVDPKKRGRSVEAQFRDGRAVCRGQGWPIKDEFPDIDASASAYATKPREQYEKMLALIRSGTELAPHQRYVIVVWEASRLSRNLEEFLPLRRLCQNTGTLICVDDEIFDMRKPKDRQRLTSMVMAAETEADSIQHRNARTARLSVADGGMHGRVPYGYRREYDPDTGELLRQIPDDTTARYVVEIFERVAAQETMISIVRDFARRTVPSPGGTGWGRDALRWIALNAAYIGQRAHHGEIVGPAAWPAIVDEPTYWTVQAILKDPARRPPRGIPPNCLLSGVPLCGQTAGGDGEEATLCSGRLYRQYVRPTPSQVKRAPNTKPREIYRCITCHRMAVALQPLDAYVQAAALEWLEKPGRAEKVLEALGVTSTADTLAEIAHIESELAAARALAARRQLSVVGLAALEQGLLPQLTQARERLRASVPNPELSRLLGPEPRRVWADMLMPERRSAIRTIMEVRVKPSPARGSRAAKWLPDRVDIRWLLGA